MLVTPGLRCFGAAGGTVVSNRQKTGSQYLGGQPSPGGLRGNGGPATSARAGYRQERLDQDHWTAARRSETARHVSAPNQTALNEVRGFSAPRKGRKAQALLVLGEKAETTQTINIVPTPTEYWICTTFKRERMYRSWFLETNRGLPLLQIYEKLAVKFPLGLADVAELPEELSGAVKATGSTSVAR